MGSGIDHRKLTIFVGPCLEIMHSLPSKSVQAIVTSPPYWRKRDYGDDLQIGLEETPQAFVTSLVYHFREARRLLTESGTAWVVIGDTYASSPPGNKEGSVSHRSTLNGVQGDTKYRESLSKRHGKKLNTIKGGLKPKDLALIPARLAIGLQEDGWFVRSIVIWHKPNGTPESVTDRPTQSYEQVLLLSKNARYFYGFDQLVEPSVTRGKKNGRDVWSILPEVAPKGSHVAVFPEELARRCILGGSSKGDLVLDPFMGSGTTGVVARSLKRRFVGIELIEDVAKEARKRIKNR